MTTPHPDRTLTLHIRNASTDEAVVHFVLTLLGPGDDVLTRVHGDSRYRAFCNLADHFEPAIDELDRKAADDAAESF